MTYSVLLHSFTMTFRFHYNFVHLYGVYENIAISMKTLYGKATQLKLLSQI